MFNSNFKNDKGFTLIELLVVVSLVGILIGLSTDIIVSVIRTYSKAQIQNEVEQNANFASLKIEKELRTAASITSISSDGSQLDFRNADDIEVSYRVSEGVLYRSVDGVEKVISNNDTLNGVNIYCPEACFSLSNPSSEDPVVVRVNLSVSQNLSQNKKPFTGAVSVDNTIVIRSSY